MADKIIGIRADLPDLSGILDELDRMGQDLPYTQEAVKTATEIVQRTWIDYISGHQVSYSGGTFRVNIVTGDYVRSIVNGVSYPALGDKLTGEVTSLSSHANIVEEGIRPFDMKATHLSGPKVKFAKDGTRYVTIPFRHNTPGSNVSANAMPQQVYQRAMGLAISRRNNLLQYWYTGNKYSWGDRLSSQNGGPKEKPHWSTGRYTGMVKMSGKPQTTYLTFRRISEKSDSRAWRHPGVRPRPVTEAVEENVRQQVLDLIRVGFEVDIARLGF